MRWSRSTSEVLENSSKTIITTGGCAGARAGADDWPHDAAVAAKLTASSASAIRTRRDSRGRSAVDRGHARRVVALARRLGQLRVDAGEVVVAELDVGRREVLLEVLAALGAGDRDDV